MAKICVVGSVNMDIVFPVAHIPIAGETAMASGRRMNPGGKGGNQAVAAARLGGDCAFVGCVGEDDMGRALLDSMADAGVDVGNVAQVPGVPTGNAFICVADSGENMIVVHAGANHELSPARLNELRGVIEGAEYMIVQLEIPHESAFEAVRMAKRAGVKVLLNPSPVCAIARDVLQDIYALVPNEGEMEALFGVKLDEVNERLPEICREYRMGAIVLTAGGDGVYFTQGEGVSHEEAQKVVAKDTTGAGDCFMGALSVALSEGKSLAQAVRFANRAAAISVTRDGAQCAMPKRCEIKEESI